MDSRQRLIVALDVSTAAAARKIVAAVGDSAHAYKIGMQLYTAEGPDIVSELVGSGRSVFLDLKYHDIPNTVGAAVCEAAQLGVDMLAVLALSNGCKGVVASALEAAALREEFGHDFAIVTPGVRLAGSGPHDQARVVTPAEAIAAGASHIVVGRPITEASDPAAEARAILGQVG